MPMAVCSIRAFIRFLGGGSSVSFSRLQSDFPYTIFTPFRRGVVWNCMKLYSGHLCRKYAEIKNYRYLWSTIEIQNQVNRPRYLISYSKILLYYRYFMLSDFGVAPSFLTVRVRFSQWMAAPIKPISHPCAARFPTVEHMAGGCGVLLLGFGQRLAVFSRRSPSLVQHLAEYNPSFLWRMPFPHSFRFRVFTHSGLLFKAGIQRDIEIIAHEIPIFNGIASLK